MAIKGPWEFENPLCASVGVDSFYKDLDGLDDLSSDSINEQNQVISMCRQCPCVTDCAEWGISKERWGIWGGLTPKERERIRRRRRRAGVPVNDISLLP